MVDCTYGKIHQYVERLITGSVTITRKLSGNCIFISAPTNIVITLPAAKSVKLHKFNFIRTGDLTGTVTIDAPDLSTITIRDETNKLKTGFPSIISAAGAASKGAVVELISDGTEWFGTRVCSGWT